MQEIQLELLSFTVGKMASTIFLEDGAMLDQVDMIDQADTSETIYPLVFASDTDEEEPTCPVVVQGKTSHTIIRIRDTYIRFKNITGDESNMIKSLCSYIGYAQRDQGKDLKYFELDAQVNVKLFRVFKFEFVAKYMLLNNFLKRGDLKYESWDRYYATIPFTIQRKDIVDGDAKKCYRFGRNNSMNITTSPHVAKLYRNSLIKFGKLQHMRCHDDGVTGCLFSISYPGSKNVEAARLSIFLRLNPPYNWEFVKLQTGW